MPEPINKLMALAPHQRMRETNRIFAGQFDRPTPQDGSVVDRAGLLPLATYDNGQTGLAFPGMIAGPVEAFNRLYQDFSGPGYETGTARTAEDAFEVAGGAATGTLMSPKPSNAVGVFGGRLAKTADQGALAKAQALEMAGAPREQIWNSTGWFKGPDQKWRFEIDDPVIPGQKYGSDVSKRSGPLNDITDAKAVSDAYPSVGNVNTSIETGNPSIVDGRGYYINGGYLSGPSEINVSAYQNNQANSVLSHEVQHAIQSAEGFSSGSSPLLSTISALLRGDIKGIGRDGYRRSAGEVEARAVENRSGLSASERRDRPPWLDYDVPEQQQIVRTNRLFGGQ